VQGVPPQSVAAKRSSLTLCRCALPPASPAPAHAHAHSDPPLYRMHTVPCMHSVHSNPCVEVPEQWPHSAILLLVSLAELL
jgi:hypothetical protein